MIEIANTENKIDGVDYKVFTMEDIKNLDKEFDIVISSLAFHYIEDFYTLMNDIGNILNDNGYLVFSQEHPNTTCIKFTENMIKNHTITDDKYYGLISDYNRIGKRKRHWFGQDAIKYHRNFETIINTLTENSLIIDKIFEPTPTNEIIKKFLNIVINGIDHIFYLLE